MSEPRHYPVEQALKAQRALRDAAGLAPEQFPLEAFVGMVSDEIERLRNMGKSNEDIARIIEQSSNIKVTASEIEAHYAPPEQRHPHS